MSKISFQWTCSYCDHHQVVTEANFQRVFTISKVGESTNGIVGTTLNLTRCLNIKCNELSIQISLDRARFNTLVGIHEAGQTLKSWNLLPESRAIPQPDYIPAPIREDYYEACLIRDKSPKAAAALARRCLQGMIRHFCGITKKRLIDEIIALKKALEDGHAPRGITSETIDAIDAVRKVGNIGAHMERDIDVIVEVDPGEAQALIELLEMLFDEWYVSRHKSEERLKKVIAMAAQKEAELAAAEEALLLPGPDIETRPT